MDTLLRDIRHALRMMARSPGFTAVAAAALALGIGANSAIYSVVNGVLLRPLPYGGAERVVQIWNHWEGWPQTWLSPPEYQDFATRSRTLEHVAAYTSGGRNLTGGDAPERVRVGFTTASAFPALGVQARLGRVYGAEEDRPGGPRVAVLGWGLWQRRFAGDPAIVGRTVLLNDSAVTVLGVMPPGFQLPTDFVGQPMDLWMPLQLDPGNPGARGGHYLYALARVRQGVAVSAAVREVEAIAKRMTEEFKDSYSPAFGSTAVPVSEQIVGKVRPALLVLAGAVGFVLLIACANVANLLLARSEARQREIAVRVALGAGRGRIVRQLLTESVMLSLAGGALGLLLAFWSVGALRAAAPESIPRAADAAVDGTVLAFTLAVALATGILFGLVPALHATRPDLQNKLREGGRSGGAMINHGPTRVLVVAELSLALVLVIGAGLLVQSFARLLGVSPGFNPAGVLTMQLSLPASKYAGSSDVWRFYRQLLERVEEVPGVQGAAGVRALPMTGPIGDWGFQVEGRHGRPQHEAWSAGDWQVVTPDYFRVMQIPLKQGRGFTSADDERAPGAIVINEELAKKAFPGGNAVGQRVRLGGGSDTAWRTVVGIVGNVRSQGLDAEIRTELYLPHAQWPLGGGTPQRNLFLLIRSAGDPAALTAAIRREVRSLDPNLPVASIRTLDEVVGGWAAERRLTMLVLSGLAAVALALAAVGIYGVMAYSVAQRTQELGIRMALGASPRDVLALVLRQGAALAAVGIALGLAGAAALTRLLSGMLYEMSATDPATFGALALLLAAVALFATYIPARRATRVDPVTAIRND